MIPSAWYTYSAAVLWQVFLHSLVTAGIFYFWLRRIGLPSGRTRRWLLGSILILPMLTASLPGRDA
ncbi:MAG: hypothetical protein JSV80_14470, partial [Acidobacteriota bacterium]